MNTAQRMDMEHIGVSVPDVITLTARLAQLLAQEVDLLQAMKVSGIEPLQEEKQLIVSALQRQKIYIEQHPEALELIGAQEREELRSVVEIFDAVLAENFRRLQMARAVNQKMVEAIADAVAESQSNGVYDQKGQADVPTGEAWSIALNKTV